METNDPFGSILKHCLLSSSQEDCLRGLNFSGEPNESEDIPLESTGIVLVTPPETTRGASSEDSLSVPVDRHDEDQTVDGDGDGAIDLGRDTDLGFSEPELRRRIESEGVGFESEEARVLNRESRLGGGISENPSKRLKIYHSEIPRSCLGIETDDTGKRLVKSMQKLKFTGLSPFNKGSLYNCPAGSQQCHETCEGRLTKRKLNFSTEVLESQKEENNEQGNLGESVEVIDKFMYVDGSVDLERKTWELRECAV
ncbi:hypothetical protein CFOL_v3_23226 [Cephalotus follicularis]|uniref:Uncharacterized protein n=1 Tax=Cephalotus follicularis TaxID=3775 RepID=A0A1Q3CI54_CEPFO|nr:hypothetical protein CFOL_v3_23226 [Cephalotus follicularis]